MTEKKILTYLELEARKNSKIKRMILFGSRARREETDYSDFDIAIETLSMTNGEWSRWEIEVREQIPTLLGLDLIWLNELKNEKLKEIILKEGKVFYELRKL